MPKTGRNIYKRKDGRWEGRFTKERDNNGKIIYGYTYGKSCTEVKQQLAALNAAEPSSAVLLTPAVQTGNNPPTFAAVAKQWLSVASLKVKPSTYAGYVSTLELHILPSIGAREIESLTAADVSRFAKCKMESGRTDGLGGLSAKTVRDMLSIVKTILDFAYKENIIRAGFTIAYPKHQPQTMRVLSRQEQKLLEAVLTRDMDVYKLGILLCLYTGIRIGEVCALCWQDISPEFNSLSVKQTIQRRKNLSDDGNKTKILIGAPKSIRSVREIPIPKFITPYLRSFARESHLYVLGTDNTVFTEPRTMQNHFAKAVSTANISEANYHSLRHTFATRCVEAGVDVKSLSEILGHANVNITLNRYVHSSFDQKRESMDKLEQYFGM